MSRIEHPKSGLGYLCQFFIPIIAAVWKVH